MTQKGVEEELKRLLVEKDQGNSRERERNSRLSGSSGMFTMGFRLSDSGYSESATENDGWVAKRAKPGFVLKR